MKVIGLIGGMSWESSAEYYKIINETIRDRLGGLHSGEILMRSVDFSEIELLQHAEKWDEAGQVLVEAAKSLEQGGADFIGLCTNTMHKVADAIQKNIDVSFLHIVDATAVEIQKKNLRKVGLLATKFTMEEEFYKGRMKEKYEIDTLIPDVEDRELIHKVIYEELCMGKIKKDSKKYFTEVIRRLLKNGAEGIILGCTEIGLLINNTDISAAIFDSAKIHAVALADNALEVD